MITCQGTQSYYQVHVELTVNVPDVDEANIVAMCGLLSEMLNKMYGAYTPLEKCSVTDVPSIGNGKMHTQFTAQDLSDITFNKTSYRFYHNKKLYWVSGYCYDSGSDCGDVQDNTYMIAKTIEPK